MTQSGFFNKFLSYGFATGEVVGRSMLDSVVYAVDSWSNGPEDWDNATWGDLKDIAGPSGRGFSINGTDFLRDAEHCYRNFICIGGTGSGKSTIVAAPSLLSANGPSIICHDASGQLAQWTAPCSMEKGYRVYVLDFKDERHSVCINPIDFIQSPADANILATHLVRASMGTGAKDRFWELASASLIRLLICAVMKQAKEYRNLANVQRLLVAMLAEPRAVDKLMCRLDDALFMEYKALIRGNEKTLSSIIMSAQAALSLWENEAVCRLTSKTTIDFKSFRENKSILFLKNATFDAMYYRPLLSLILENVIKIYMEHLPQRGGRPIWFICDEMDTLQIQSLDTILSNNRKYFLGFMLFYQSLSQLQKYGQDVGKTILGNCFSKLFLSGCDMQTADELEHLIGKTTIPGERDKKRIVPLMPAQKIRMLQPDTAILVAGAHKPFLVPMTPFYKSPFINMHVGNEPFIYTPNEIPIDVPLIPLL